jgi:uncharacterized protein
VSSVERVALSVGAVEVAAAVHRPGGDEAEPLFFMTHGAGGNLDTPGLVALAEVVAGSGHLAVRADLPYRAAGRKTPPAAERSVAGLSASFEEAKRRFGPGKRWVVGGRSYGGRVASMAVADGLEVAGLLLYSYPLHRPGDASQPRVEHWPKIRVPVLFLEGTDDPFCNLELFDRLLVRLGGEATVHLVAGGDHSLKVPAARAADGKGRSERAVVKSLAPAIERWAAGLVHAP